jgi:hypothetical protein
MDGATVFVLILACAFFGFIAYLAIVSRRNAQNNASRKDQDAA